MCVGVCVCVCVCVCVSLGERGSLRLAELLPNLTQDERRAKAAAAMKWVKNSPLGGKPLVKTSVQMMPDEGVKKVQMAMPNKVRMLVAWCYACTTGAPSKRIAGCANVCVHGSGKLDRIRALPMCLDVRGTLRALGLRISHVVLPVCTVHSALRPFKCSMRSHCLCASDASLLTFAFGHYHRAQMPRTSNELRTPSASVTLFSAPLHPCMHYRPDCGALSCMRDVAECIVCHVFACFTGGLPPSGARERTSRTVTRWLCARTRAGTDCPHCMQQACCAQRRHRGLQFYT